MKKLLVFALLGAILCSGVYGFIQYDKEKVKTEQTALTSAAVKIESKEALKVDDAEFTTAVATKFSNVNAGNLFGLTALVGLAALFFSSKWERLPRAVQGGLGLVALALITLVDFGMTAAMAGATKGLSIIKAGVPFLAFKKDGLTGDNLKFVEDLEKRISTISEAELKEMLGAELKLAVREAKEQLKRFDALSDEQINKIKEFTGEDDKGIRSILVKQGELITKLQQNVSNAEERMDIRGQVQEWQTRNKDVFAKIKNKETGVSLQALEIRAANSPMTPANTETNTITINAGAAIRQGAPIFELRRVEPTFWDYIPKGRTNLETYPWVNKKVPADSGAAAFIGPGIAKPGVSFTLEVEKSNAKKVAVSMKLATELLEDVDGMTSFVQGELTYQLKAKINTTLMTGVLSGTVIAGVQTFSVGFTTSGLSTQNPNNWDCARALIAQHRKAFINGPIVIFMNPIDTANMDMEKAVSQGTYLGINARPIPGGIIVEDNNIPVGFVQSIALDCLKTLIYKDYSVAFGWENADFTLNLITAIAEMRLHSFHSENDAQAFIYDDLADIKSQIAAA